MIHKMILTKWDSQKKTQTEICKIDPQEQSRKMRLTEIIVKNETHKKIHKNEKNKKSIKNRLTLIKLRLTKNPQK